MRGVWLLLPFATFAACGGSDEEHPPQYSPDASTSAPRKCDEVRMGEAKKGGAVWYDGEPAACGAEGLQCPVYDLAAFAGVCAMGTPVATCKNLIWMVSCDLDAGVLDATIGD